MNNFKITTNDYLKKSIQAYYHQDYKTFGTEGNPDFINHLKNSFDNTRASILQKAVNDLIKVLNEDLPKIKTIYSNLNLIVCVTPRAKAESFYSANQKLFKRVISNVVDNLSGLSNGVNYIIRHTNTRTTHMNKSNYGGDGDMPYVGITKATCTFSHEIRGKDILLIDDIYTQGVNIDEDAIQALMDKGAKSVIFYSVGKTLKGGFNTTLNNENLNKLSLNVKKTYLLLNNIDDLDEIVNETGFTKGTIIKHLGEISEKIGDDLLKKFKPSYTQIQKVKNAIDKIGSKDKLRPIFDELNESVSYDDIKLCLIFLK